MGRSIHQKYRTRFFYLQVFTICLFISLLVWSLIEGTLNNLRFPTLALPVAGVLGGVVLWVLIVSFPAPFPRQVMVSGESFRDILQAERIKTCMLVLALSSTLFLLHTRNDPPFPKTGFTILACGFVWCNWILWPEAKRIWREDRKRRQDRPWWKWGW